MSKKPHKTKPNYQDNVRTISFNSLWYDPSAGWYSVVNSRWEAGYFHYCREMFHREGKVKRMCFTHAPNEGKQIASFISKVEELLDIPDRSVFGSTTRNKITWIKVSPWWLKQAMRRSLFTALLRAGQYYNQKLYDENNKKKKRDLFWFAVENQTYLIRTLPAVKRFFTGRTKYKGKAVGWDRAFHHKTRKQLKELLV